MPNDPLKELEEWLVPIYQKWQSEKEGSNNKPEDGVNLKWHFLYGSVLTLELVLAKIAEMRKPPST